MARYVSWYDVMRGFTRSHNGIDPSFNPASGWLNVAVYYEAKGLQMEAAACMEAAMLREAFERNPYEPPVEYQRLYVPTPSA